MTIKGRSAHIFKQLQWRLKYNMYQNWQAFLPRDACVSALFAVARCLSARPSDTLVYCTQKAENIVKTSFSARWSNHSRFLIPSSGIQFQGEPLHRGRIIQGVGNFSDFRLKSPVRDAMQLLWNVNI